MIRVTFKFGGVVEYPEAGYCENKDGIVQLKTHDNGETVAELLESDIAKIDDAVAETPCPESPSSGS